MAEKTKAESVLAQIEEMWGEGYDDLPLTKKQALEDLK